MKGNRSNVTVPWGRGASEHRPGVFTKQYLMENGEACAADVFHALRDNLELINRERIQIGEKPIRGCTYNSFARYWHVFKLAGLIEPTGEIEPAIYHFLKKRVLYKLTAEGVSEEAVWLDPARTSHLEFD
jgi:hypothetical protein